MGFSVRDVRFTRKFAHCVNFVRDVCPLILLLMKTLDLYNRETNRCFENVEKPKSRTRKHSTTQDRTHN